MSMAPQPETGCPICGSPVVADLYGWECEEGHRYPSTPRPARKPITSP